MNTTTNEVSNGALEIIYLRNEFYKRKFFLAIILFVFSILCNVGAAGILWYLVNNPPHPLYFAADSVGRLMQEVPLNSPNMTDDEVTAWVVEAVQAAYTFDYTNYRAELQSAQKYFTNYGWRNYMQGLTASRNLEALTQYKWIQLGNVVSPPVLKKKGLMAGRYAYEFEMPLFVAFWQPPYNDSERYSNGNPFVVTVLIRREPLLQSYKGLGVVQMNAKFAT